MESQTIKITSAAAVIVFLLTFIWNAHGWAEDKHHTLKSTVDENSKQISALVVTIQLLSQVQSQQVEIIKDAARSASENNKALVETGKALVRIETKLEAVYD
jgi:ABC-type transporter Mla subunit MlaD